MLNWLCWIGVHKWGYPFDIVRTQYTGNTLIDLIIELFGSKTCKKKCRRCGKVDLFDYPK